MIWARKCFHKLLILIVSLILGLLITNGYSTISS
jgi:hypothetical protein